MRRPIDTIDIPDDSEPDDNMTEALRDRLAWEWEFIEEHAEEDDETARPE